MVHIKEEENNIKLLLHLLIRLVRYFNSLCWVQWARRINIRQFNLTAVSDSLFMQQPTSMLTLSPVAGVEPYPSDYGESIQDNVCLQ